MMAVKGGTQTFSKAEQQVDLGRDNTRTISADQQQQFFGDQALGDIANKASDPNWIDPAKKVRQVGNAQMDKDAFMKLLLTQMKYQDPTNPMQSHEMAAQLAQFTSLEKLTNISEGIDGLAKAQAPSHQFEALSLIGKAVAGDSARIDRMDEKDTHAISFSIQQDAPKVKVTIKNAEGMVIRELEASNMKAGKNEIPWNGQSDAGQSVQKGTYSATIEAVGSNGAKLFADTKFQGVISGVNFTAQGPVLMIGKQTVALKDIKEIVDPKLATPSAPKSNSGIQIQGLPPGMNLPPGFALPQGMSLTPPQAGAQPAAAPQASSATTQVSPTGTESKSESAQGNLENVGMSRAMINQLRKDGAKTSI